LRKVAAGVGVEVQAAQVVRAQVVRAPERLVQAPAEPGAELPA
jgi:hypothetical protein